MAVQLAVDVTFDATVIADDDVGPAVRALVGDILAHESLVEADAIALRDTYGDSGLFDDTERDHTVVLDVQVARGHADEVAHRLRSELSGQRAPRGMRFRAVTVTDLN